MQKDTESLAKKEYHHKRAAIICVGNMLCGDDGLGVWVYERLFRSYRLPEGVDLFEVACLSLDMVSYVSSYDYLLVIDAFWVEGVKPGTLMCCSSEELAQTDAASLSLHDLSLSALFDAARLLGYEAEGLCLGVCVNKPFAMEMRIGLSEEVECQIPALIELVNGELQKCEFGIIRKR